MKNEDNPEPAAAVFAGAAHPEGFARQTYSANLSAPGTGKVENTTESGSELIWSCNIIHSNYFNYGETSGCSGQILYVARFPAQS